MSRKNVEALYSTHEPVSLKTTNIAISLRISLSHHWYLIARSHDGSESSCTHHDH